MRRQTQSDVGPTLLLLAALSCGSHQAPAQTAVTASNQDVLTLWGQLTQSTPPQLQVAKDGSTQLTWTGGVTGDLYTQSSSGGPLLTSVRPGQYYRANLRYGLQALREDGKQSWLRFDFTQSNDQAVVPFGHQINLMQVGVAGAGYSLSAGDVLVSYSSLSAYTAMRGVSLQTQLGTSSFSAVAGAITPSWETLMDPERRIQPVRNGYAAKLEFPVSNLGAVYATAQGYADESGWTAPIGSTIAPASAVGTTLGLRAARAGFELQGEVGISRWQEDGGDDQVDRALILDAVWRRGAYRVSAGYHDLGRNYRSLSAQALPGLKETYVNLGWSASQSLSLAADLRRTQSLLALQPPALVPAAPVPPYTAYSASLQANFASQSSPGFTASATGSQSTSQVDGSGRSVTRSASGQIGHTLRGWSPALSVQVDRISSDPSGAGDGRRQSWTGSVARNWNEGLRTPLGAASQASLGMSASVVRNEFELGTSSILRTFTLSASVEPVKWGRLSLALVRGFGHDSAAGAIDQYGLQLEGSRAIGKHAALKLYSRYNQYTTEFVPGYRDAVVGLQLSVSR